MTTTQRKDPCACGSGRERQHCCANASVAQPVKQYVNAAHRFMDEHVLKGRYPDLYGFLILVEHHIAATEIWDQLRHWTERYLGCKADRSRKFHGIVDETIARQLEIDKQQGYRPPYCHKGCSNCCYQPVACTDEEAQLIHDYCNDHGVRIDYEKLERQRHFIAFDSEQNFTGETTWDAQPTEDQACIFLNEQAGTCSIWEVRPFVCRVHFAEKTNAYCRSRNGTVDTRASGIHHPESSFILSSIFTIHHDSIGKMMNQLLRKLK